MQLGVGQFGVVVLVVVGVGQCVVVVECIFVWFVGEVVGEYCVGVVVIGVDVVGVLVVQVEVVLGVVVVVGQVDLFVDGVVVVSGQVE